MKGKDVLKEINEDTLKEKKKIAKQQIKRAMEDVTRLEKELSDAKDTLNELKNKKIEDFEEYTVTCTYNPNPLREIVYTNY